MKKGIFISTSTKAPVCSIPGMSLLCCFTICWLMGCSRKVAEVNLPYETLQTFSLPGETEAPDQWWQAFEDPELNLLVDSALASTLPLNAFWYQFQEARALVNIASSARVPDVFLQLQSGISRPEPDFVGGENTQLSLRANYEADLWGRIRYSIHAEEYRFKASFYDYKTAAVTLTGEVALAWFRLKATNIQLQLLGEQIETNEQVLALIRNRFASGQVRGVDILRQQQLIESTVQQQIALELQKEMLENQLSILLGQPPGELLEAPAQLPDLPPLPLTGVPLQLVNRRPDVLSSFYRLQAADREVAAAISNRYPRLNLSLNAALRSNTLIGLFESQAISLGSSLLAPVFYGGRLRAQVNQAEAIRQQLRYDYGQTVLLAFQEIENALIQETKQLERVEVIQNQVELAEKTFGQLRVEYLNGSLAYLDVLVTLNQQQQLQRDLINAELELLEIRIALYRALAGGFETEREPMLEEEP
ncbi:TolC family protein [Pontibacter diazotrophicus]|uniref:TolC family protein n=1 Tax=Pontibacter diazotrophicus TaxID=1400979 RepID=A0A3D8L6N0_9BACT|nr:TolC family protein [Pontibacter diazotrophicus]RDV12946.1 TolC family protein [Pontibacter diazotrophicus]